MTLLHHPVVVKVEMWLRKLDANWICRHLAPIWVLPEFQGRSIASVLLNDAIAIADKDGKREPMYLEAMPAARAIYARFGWKSVVGDGEKNVMIRNAPENVPVQGEEEWKRRGSSQ